ncbi:MAG: site-specific integrase [Flavobacteriaceae bacterium]|nr:site-specific integrase [Flavobacteriaceae bacterium]
MPNNSLSYPKVCKRKDGKYYVDFKLNNKRYRLFSGRLIGSSLNPNSYPAKQRYSAASTLAKQVYEFIVSNDYSLTKPVTTLEHYDSLIRDKLAEPLSNSYRKTLIQLSNVLREQLNRKGCITSLFIDSIPLKYSNNTSYNTTRRHVNVLANYLHSRDFPIELSKLKTRKQDEVLHSPISNVKELLNRIKEFNENLYLCCLFTYGCLLRPHQEIRLLKWEDFSEDLTHINLTGRKVKSKRNRIVPVPTYIRDVLIKRDSCYNIFSNTKEPFNKGYFSLLWRRFKRLNPSIGPSITIYSFRHTGAIEIFKRTGSITKLQKAMGHSSINVSLTYLRGLEIPELNEEDMPMM